MATCDMGHEHDDVIPEPAPVVVEADPGPNENDVQIAEIQAAADVAIAKEGTKREEAWQEARVAELEGRVQGMREILDRLAPPEPEPEVVPVPVPTPAPEPAEEVSAPPETAPKKAGNKGGGWWDGYS